MQGFSLCRIEDVSGVSGTGRVAEGVIFSDGTVALRWLVKLRSSCFYASLADCEEIHSHGGKTKIVFEGQLS